VLPGIIAAAALALVLSIDDYVITRFVAGGVSTLPLWIYGASRIGVPAQVNVIGTLILLFGVVYTLLTVWRTRRGKAGVVPPMLTKG
jgi:spermidine/putrescine transport system permease protein